MGETMMEKAGLTIDPSIDDIISNWTTPGATCPSPYNINLSLPKLQHRDTGPGTTTGGGKTGSDDERKQKKQVNKTDGRHAECAKDPKRRNMQSVWGPDGPDIDEGVAPKRQRLFIARQACEICRQKKTRCDGGNPCGLCRAAGIECKYAERKATKNEVSLGMIFNTLQRIESKIEDQQDRDDERRHQKKLKAQNALPKKDQESTAPSTSPSFSVSQTVLPPILDPNGHNRPFSSNSSPAGDFASPSAASTHSRDGHVTSGIHALLSAASPTLSQAQLNQPRPYRPRHVPVIQYPIRQLANWPVIRTMLEKSGNRIDESGTNRHNPYIYDAAAATILEQRRPPLPVPLLPTNENWLAQLSISTIKDLGDRYFSTFNIANPILDRRLFSQHSLGVAIHTGFGVNIESCLVLVTMALGVLGRKALRESGMMTEIQSPFEQLPRGDNSAPDDDSWDGGLVFFNEARKRVGLLGTDTSLQSCQFHLLSGLYYAQLARPIDWWTHVSRAGICCTSFWACVPKDCDDWTMDMQSRLFWITAMFEAVVTQELDVPGSNLHNFEERVPLPKFVDYPGGPSFGSIGGGTVTGISGIQSSSNNGRSQEEEQDSFCHYHFLSQIAHRIILTRLCDSLFANRGKALASGQTIESVSQATTLARSDYPPQNLENELLHQLEQWRSQLPGYLQWEDDNTHRYADPSPQPMVPLTPTNVLVVPWLQARYCISRYHLRRPLLHRALHHPDWMTRDDFDKCRDALDAAVRWCSVIRTTLDLMDCLYLKYFICTQLFGMLLLFHALDISTVPELRQLVPATYESWRAFAINFLEQCAPSSPSISRELELVLSLRGNTNNTDGNQMSSGPYSHLGDFSMEQSGDHRYARSSSARSTLPNT
ncbi:zinc c6 finger domain protein [Ophiostoma piceae UAMH 11346]|uniref:Zinc c6 finger domain protein n=1 Tax=Ophiostoma piceae (strain UAMH 11346) TaxID=1262450 RepID=S3CRV9_OPHP1|nr:zinc c6 finger domain protein [Ophiostoma piceae UAMH 11346]